MLRDWINNKRDREGHVKGTEKNWVQTTFYYELEMENRLLELFKEARQPDEKPTDLASFAMQKTIYGSIYSHRITKISGKLTEYT